MFRQKTKRIIFLLDEIKERIESLGWSETETMNLDIILEDLRMVYREVELIKLKTLGAVITDEVEERTLPEKNQKNTEIIQNENTADHRRINADEEKTILPPIYQDEVIIVDSGRSTQENLAIAEVDVFEAHENATLEVPAVETKTPSIGNQKLADGVQHEKSGLFMTDKLKVEDNSIYQKFLSENEDNSIGSRMQATKIGSIRESIGLNEKFLFINELFSGNIQDYNSAIEKLNGFEVAQGAFDYLNELGKTCKWDFDRSENTIRMLVNLVQRRYLKG